MAIMLDRLISYFVIVAATFFSAVQGFAIIRHVRLQTGQPTPDFIRAIGIMIAIMGIVVCVRSLRHGEGSSITKRSGKRSGSPSHGPQSLADSLRQVSAVSIRRPVLAPIFFIALVTIPVGLVVLSKPHGWKDFGTGDWIGIGVAGMPFVFLAFLSVIASRKSKWADHQGTRNERMD